VRSLPSDSLQLHRHYHQVIRNVQDKTLARDLAVNVERVAAHSQGRQGRVISIIHARRIHTCRYGFRPAARSIE
jgi:hypothetical protein